MFALTLSSKLILVSSHRQNLDTEVVKLPLSLVTVNGYLSTALNANVTNIKSRKIEPINFFMAIPLLIDLTVRK